MVLDLNAAAALRIKGHGHRVTRQQAVTLAELGRYPGRLRTHDGLLCATGSEASAEGLRVEVHHLNRILRASDSVHIDNVRGIGYVLLCKRKEGPTP